MEWKREKQKNTQKRIQIDLCSSHHRSLTYIKKNTRSNRSYSTAFVYRVYVSVCVCVCVIFFHWHSNRSYVLFPFFGRFFDSFAFLFCSKIAFFSLSLPFWLIDSIERMVSVVIWSFELFLIRCSLFRCGLFLLFSFISCFYSAVIWSYCQDKVIHAWST